MQTYQPKGAGKASDIEIPAPSRLLITVHRRARREQLEQILSPMKLVDVGIHGPGDLSPPYHSLPLPPWYTSARQRPVTTAGIGENAPGLSIPNTK
ncbi:MAG: hypothetical protein ABSF46_14635 [Terriglobia bacterium]